jgi:YjbE family integral membrane protein
MLDLILRDFSHLGDSATLVTLLQVLMIDLTLAGDNAIVVGALAAGLPPAQRRKVIALGVLAALVLRLIFALVVTQLLQVVGLVLAGGLLLWVSWKMWRELYRAGRSRRSQRKIGDAHPSVRSAESFSSAAWSVAVADVSMSLDNVLGVASAAKDHPGIMIVGLFFAVALMGIAANLIARFIDRYRLIAWLGIATVLWVAGTMIWDGITDHDIGVLKLL